MHSIVDEDLTDPGANQKLTGHLKSDDFFGVDKHPTATFKIVEATPIATQTPGGPTHTVKGDLTIKGQTQSVSFPATITVAGDKGEANATVMVDRTLYGIRYGSGKFFQNLGDKMISDEFELRLKLVANKTS
jgi:polyisoprenoid-binding protein YceI